MGLNHRLLAFGLGFVSASTLALVPAQAEDYEMSPAPTMDAPTDRAPATETSPEDTATTTVVDVAAENADFSTLVSAIQAADLADTLAGDGPFTVFAPTNEAFAKLPEETLQALMQPENRQVLAKILTYHVVPGEVMAADLTDGPITTVEGNAVMINLDDGVGINDATVVTPDIMASNGVIHAIDEVILPPDLFAEEATPDAAETMPAAEISPTMTTPEAEEAMPPTNIDPSMTAPDAGMDSPVIEVAPDMTTPEAESGVDQ